MNANCALGIDLGARFFEYRLHPLSAALPVTCAACSRCMGVTANSVQLSGCVASSSNDLLLCSYRPQHSPSLLGQTKGTHTTIPLKICLSLTGTRWRGNKRKRRTTNFWKTQGFGTGHRFSGSALVVRLGYRSQMKRENPPDLSILLSGGKETNKDSPSNGE